MTTPSEEPSVSIGDVHGSTFAIGSHAHAESHTGGGAPQTDEATRELLAAVRELRADLTRLRDDDGQLTTLDAELAETEGDITRTGRAPASRIERLRALLADSQAVVSLLASAGTVAGMLGNMT
ncbi:MULTISPECIES: hypothetical protein [unclassified Streptomyces]|uniref:hypothetical protein n=1 Tax=unclassified Streptomyces TaxID=2593676 RepID=UPI00278C8D68|nr:MULTISPECIES: hypothetical protein [unclassified Streptomyces]